MGNAGPQRQARAYRMLGVKAFFDVDQDIVTWWDALPERQRGQVLRALIREHLGKEASADVLALKKDVQGMMRGLNGVARTLDQLSQRLASGAVLAAESGTGGHEPTADEQERLRQRLKANPW